MATATTNDADEIRQRMAKIRRELHADVRDVVASAEAVTDWRRYIRMYPWAALGLTVAAGYLIVPRRHQPAPAPAPTSPADAAPANAAEVRAVIEQAKQEEKEPERKGLIGLALGFVTPIALRAAQGYAVQYLESWIAQQQQAMGVGPAHPPGQPDRAAARGADAGSGRPQAKPPF